MLSGQPIIILKENVERNRGQEAQRSNIMAAKAIAGAVRTTLGPRGMDKMLVSPSGDVVITNDGATILKEIAVQHPGAKMVIEVAKAQDEEVGDGTTTAVVLVGSLMEKAELMLAKKIHPTVITQGYRMGMEKALEILDDLSVKVKPTDRDILIRIADTAMTGKSIEQVKTKVDEIAVDAVMTVAEKVGTKYRVDEDNVMIKKQRGETMNDAELIRGVVIDKARLSEDMPRKVTNAKVALVSGPLEIKKTQVKAKIKISSTEQVNAFSMQERETLKKFSDSIVAVGANVLLCQKGIADSVQFYLSKAGIFAIEDIPEKDMQFAAKALSATIVNKVNDLTEKDLGEAELVEQDDDVDLVKISGCKNPQAVTILLRGSTDYLLDELERAVFDGTRVVMDVMEDEKYVAGGGAVETELLIKVREYASTVGGRIQLAIEAYADSFEVIPLTLAENSGYNQIDKLVDLKTAHAKGMKHGGLNVFTGKIIDMEKEGVIEPSRSKRQAIQSSAEAAMMLIRVDDMMVTMEKSKFPGR
ncbi:MAG: thermosome subunit alpha [Methanomicrobiales archaeon]|jgi:thermosome|nr:thermosome subunit alpha [Methanomicrobiales archaeon]